MPANPPVVFTPPSAGSPPGDPPGVFTPAGGGGSPASPPVVFVPIAAGLKATASLDTALTYFAGNFVELDEITIGSDTGVFTSGSPAPGEIAIGVDFAESIANILAFFSGHADVLVTYSNEGSDLIATARSIGEAGNSIPVSATLAAGGDWTSATLTGGAGALGTAGPPPVFSPGFGGGTPSAPPVIFSPAGGGGGPSSPPAVFTPAGGGGGPSSPPAVFTPAGGGGGPSSPPAVFAPISGGTPAAPPTIYEPGVSDYDGGSASSSFTTTIDGGDA